MGGRTTLDFRQQHFCCLPGNINHDCGQEQHCYTELVRAQTDRGFPRRLTVALAKLPGAYAERDHLVDGKEHPSLALFRICHGICDAVELDLCWGNDSVGE